MKPDKLTRFADNVVADVLCLPWVRIVCAVCVAPFLAWLAATFILKGVRAFDDPFSGPPWFHTLGWVALAGVALSFLVAKLDELALDRWIAGQGRGPEAAPPSSPGASGDDPVNYPESIKRGRKLS